MNLNIFRKKDKFLMLALDHRGSIKKIIERTGTGGPEKNEIVILKKLIISSIVGQASGILLDTEYGLPAYRELGNKTPFLLAAEKTGYLEKKEGRVTELEHSAQELKNLGARGVKLLIYFNHNDGSAHHQIATAHQALKQAHKADLPLFLEIVRYGPASSVAECVSAFLENGVRADVFKLEYPGSKKECHQVTNILENTPWILLSRGVDFETYWHQLEIAVGEGCQGFLAGRSLWQEGVLARTEIEKKIFFTETLPERFRKISETANRE